MVLIKVMKRKDASSVFVAVVLALIIVQLLSQLSMPLTNLIASPGGQYMAPTPSTIGSYVHPLVWAVLQILLFEVFSLLYTAALQLLRQNKKSKK